MYKAPIELISLPPKFDIDGYIYKAVVKCGVSVDKDELIKALQYDRDQYNKGYADAKAEVAREIFEEIIEGLQYEVDLEDKYGRNAWGQGDISGFQTHQYTEDKLDTLITALSLMKTKYTEGGT